MKIKLVTSIFVFAIVVLAGINVFKAQKPVHLSDIGKENVEALAKGEWENGQTIDCMNLIISPSPDSLGLAVYPIVVDCQPCGNLVVCKVATGKSTCVYYKVQL